VSVFSEKQIRGVFPLASASCIYSCLFVVCRRADTEEMDIVPDPFVGTPLTPRATHRSQ